MGEWILPGTQKTVDITKDILNKQMYAGVMPDILQQKKTGTPADDDFLIKDPIVVIAPPQVMDDYYIFVFLDTMDQSVKGIFWKRDAMAKALGFLKNMKTGKVRYYENCKMLKQFDQTSERVENEINSKVREFQQKYAEVPQKFEVYSSKT
jgi:hypothetical protein